MQIHTIVVIAATVITKNSNMVLQAVATNLFICYSLLLLLISDFLIIYLLILEVCIKSEELYSYGLRINS